MTSLFRDDIGHEPPLEPPEQEPVPICPCCGAETDTFLVADDWTVVGCPECVKAKEAWVQPT